MSFPKAVIIGAGVAGMASAIRLALAGFMVIVFEKNGYPGGKINQFSLGDYRFDGGPSLFTQPHYLEELFILAGEDIKEYLQYEVLPIGWRYFYEDGTILNAYTDAAKFAEELNNITGESEEKVLRYLQQSQKMYNNIGSIFLNSSLHKRRTFFSPSILKALGSLRWKYLFSTMHNINATSFSTQHVVQYFDRFATYNGSNPYKAPGMLCLISHPEHNEGAFYPKGGVISIATALYKLAVKKGVVFNFNSNVQRIINSQDKAIGVVVNDENIYADTVISNTDAYFTYKYLLNDEKMAESINKQPRSSSAIVFYWGIKKEFPQLKLHNIFFSANYKAEFEHVFNRKNLYNDPTIYINITAKMEPGLYAPPDKENWFVMVNVPHDSGQDWAQLKEQCRANIISKLNRMLQTNMEDLIEVEETLDPLLIESQTSSYRGAIYGPSSNTKKAAFIRHPNYSRQIKRLYFAGGSVHPGGGIPVCLKSAEIMTGIITKDKKKWVHH